MSDDLRITLDKHVLDALQRSLPGRADDLVEALAREGERIVKSSFNASSGRAYKRGSRIHIASRPGYPPNVDTGKLLNAIYVYKPKALERRVSTGDAEYAVPLEYGTSRMEARPFMRPMVEKLKQQVEPVMKGLIERGLT